MNADVFDRKGVTCALIGQQSFSCECDEPIAREVVYLVRGVTECDADMDIHVELGARYRAVVVDVGLQFAEHVDA